MAHMNTPSISISATPIKLMSMEVYVISREIIKPSSPTPSQAKPLKISLLDQLAPLLYTPIIFFYPTTKSHLTISQISSQLKKSLSITLARFYPFSRRVKDDLFLDCNDEGAPYLEAQVRSSMSEFLKTPKIQFLNMLLPCQPFDKLPDRASPQVVVQFNIFECGGVAIGLNFLHATIDGTTMSNFLNSWSATTRGDNQDQEQGHPDFISGASLFPAREEDFHFKLMENVVFKQVKQSTRRFVFTAEAIAKLKAKAASERSPKPSRYQAVTGFIWKSAMATSRAQSNSPRPSMSIHALELRRRMEPPLSNYANGNFVWYAPVPYDASDLVLHDLVGELKQAFQDVNSNFIRNLQGDEGFAMLCECIKMVDEQITSGSADRFLFTSWCNLGFNEVDFGWGKPIWVGVCSGGDASSSTSAGNLVIYKESCGFDGIEAWMTFDEQTMAVLEHDPEFLAFASPNPNLPSL